MRPSKSGVTLPPTTGPAKPDMESLSSSWRCNSLRRFSASCRLSCACSSSLMAAFKLSKYPRPSDGNRPRFSRLNAVRRCSDATRRASYSYICSSRKRCATSVSLRLSPREVSMKIVNSACTTRLANCGSLSSYEMRNSPCRRVSSIFILASIFVSSISICSGVLALRSWSVIRATFSRLGRLSRVRVLSSTSDGALDCTARPLSKGLNIDWVSRYTRAEAWYCSGREWTYIQPAIHKGHATSAIIQRKRHEARTRWRTCAMASCIEKQLPTGEGQSKMRWLEPRIGNNQCIARQDVHISFYIAVADQVVDAYVELPLFAVDKSLDARMIAVREGGEAADGDHHVEQGHALTIRQGLRLGRLAHHADLLAVRTHETPHQDHHQLIFNIFREGLLHLARDLRGRLAADRQIFHQGARDLAVRADDDAGGNLGVAPDEDVQGITRSHQIGIMFGVGGGRLSPQRRRQGRIVRRASPEQPEAQP